MRLRELKVRHNIREHRKTVEQIMDKNEKENHHLYKRVFNSIEKCLAKYDAPVAELLQVA